MSEPAAFRATYSDFRLIKGRKVVQFVFEVPIEESNKAFQALGGMPDPGSSVWCAVARLVNPTEETSHKSPPSPEPAMRKKSWHEMEPSQQAGVLCADASFMKFLKVEYEESAASVVRRHCRVTSRSDIKAGTAAAKIWKDLVYDYRAWVHEPEVVG